MKPSAFKFLPHLVSLVFTKQVCLYPQAQHSVEIYRLNLLYKGSAPKLNWISFCFSPVAIHSKVAKMVESGIARVTMETQPGKRKKISQRRRRHRMIQWAFIR